MDTMRTEVLVVGSGFGAAAPALRFAEAGFRVTIVEQGPRINPLKDLKQSQDPKYVLKYLKSMSGDNLSLTYAQALGGGSGFYEMVSLRAPSRAFAQLDDRGRRMWPEGVTRATMDPYYDLAERMLRVQQITAEEVPKTGQVFSLMMKRLGYSCERAPYAVRNCVGSGFCVTGCIYGAKQSLHFNYLPQAVSAGAEVETDLEAVEIWPLETWDTRGGTVTIQRMPYRYEVVCRRTDSGKIVRFRTKILVLGGGTVGTAKLLLRSRRALGHLSDQVGRNVAFNGSVKTAALLPDDLPPGDLFTGRTHAGMISYEFMESRGLSIAAGKPLPLQLVAAARITLEGEGRSPAHWGRPHVELMSNIRQRLVVLLGLGLTPPAGEIRYRGGDSFDLELDLTDALRDYYRDTKELLDSILRRNGCRMIKADFLNPEGAPRKDLHFSTAHQLGSCRMADGPERGVVDRSGEVFGHPGIYVTDGAAVPSSLAVNTALTISANAERVAAEIVGRYSSERRSGLVAA